MALVKCPGCPLELDEEDFAEQDAHMMAEHPEIVAQRVLDSKKWAGWEDDG
jgi:hypothetical protein